MAITAPRGRNSLVCPISEDFELAAADDLDGAGAAFDITGALRLVITQTDDGTAGTAGIDCVEYSFDGGYEWIAAQDIRTFDAADDSTALTNGALNAAGVEPAAGVAVFKGGPYVGPTQVRIGRDTSGRGTSGVGVDWVSGAPSVKASVIGLQRDALTAES
jgi:hypothetical protein